MNFSTMLMRFFSLPSSSNLDSPAYAMGWR
jgi:hypothetical protein